MYAVFGGAQPASTTTLGIVMAYFTADSVMGVRVKALLTSVTAPHHPLRAPTVREHLTLSALAAAV